MATELHPPFGAYRLPAWAERARRLGARVPESRLGMHMASTLRKISLMGGREPYDIEAWPGVNARVYPSTNRCEKRVFCAPQLWDRAELRTLETALAAAQAGRDFVFLDLGANVGFYSLYLDAAARRTGKTARIVAAEPDPENRRRLEENIAASGAAFVTVAPVGLGVAPGRARLAGGERNRGEVRLDLDADEGAEVEVVTVSGLAQRAGLTHIDAMKLDLEGLDADVLDAFLSEAPDAMRPQTLVLERQPEPDPMPGIAAAHGYGQVAISGINAIFRRSAAPEAA